MRPVVARSGPEGWGIQMFFEGFGSVFLLGMLLTGVVPLGLLVLAIIAVATGRGEEDTTGRRGFAIYLAGVLFITLFFSLFAVFLATESATEAVGDPPGAPYYDYGFFDDFDDFDEVPDDDDQVVRALGDATEALLVAAPAVLVFLWHQRRRAALLAEPDFARSPAQRIDQAFLRAAGFVAVLIAVVALANVLTDLLQLALPGFTDPDAPDGDVREQAARSLVPFCVLLAGSALIFRWTWRQTPDGSAPGRSTPTPNGPGPAVAGDPGNPTSPAWAPATVPTAAGPTAPGAGPSPAAPSPAPAPTTAPAPAPARRPAPAPNPARPTTPPTSAPATGPAPVRSLPPTAPAPAAPSGPATAPAPGPATPPNDPRPAPPPGPPPASPPPNPDPGGPRRF